MEKRLIKHKGHEIGNISNFKELLKRAVEKFGDKVAFKYKKDPNSKTPVYIEKTFKQYKEEAENLGTALLKMGLEEKRIAVIGPNRYEWCTTYIAALAGNMIIVPLDKALPKEEIKSLIFRSKVDAVVFDKKYADVFKEIKIENNTNLKYYICMDNLEDKEFFNYADLVNEGKLARDKGDNSFNNVKIDNQKMSIMLFTSGTTNMSKAVMLSQDNICSNVNVLPHFVIMHESDVLLSFLPIHHTFESTITFIYGCLYCGATIAFCDGLKYVVTNLKEYGVTVFVGVPLMLETMYKKLMKEIEKKGKTKLINFMKPITNFGTKIHVDIRRKVYKQVLEGLGGKLRLVLYGAAPMEKSTIEGLSSFGIDMVQGYGLTETSPVVTAETDFFKRPGSCGLVIYNDEVKIDNPDENGIGEIAVKGPNVMLGYYENEEATTEVLKDGWFYTGDLGYFDKDGFLYITGRKKDVIVLKNGKNVFPLEIEFIISKLPYVSEVMVFGNPTKDNDYVISAKIVYQEEAMQELYPNISKQDYKEIIWKDIKEKVNPTMPDFRRVKDIIVTNEPMIKTTTQKIKRAEELKQMGIM